MPDPKATNANIEDTIAAIHDLAERIDRAHDRPREDYVLRMGTTWPASKAGTQCWAGLAPRTGGADIAYRPDEPSILRALQGVLAELKNQAQREIQEARERLTKLEKML